MAVQLKRNRKSEGNITDVHSQVSFDSLYPSNTVTKTLLILYVNHTISCFEDFAISTVDRNKGANM